MDNIKEWTSLPMPELLTRAFCGEKNWNRTYAESSLMFPEDQIGQGELRYDVLNEARNDKYPLL